MHTEKFLISQLSGCIKEALPDRPLYKDKDDKVKDCVSKSNIDMNKSNLNYNLCSHAPYKEKELKLIYTKITGRQCRKDAKWGGTIITLPEELKYEPKEVQDRFFEEAYKAFKKIYNLKEDDVICACVHYDETTPHMHFYFIPHYYDYENGAETIAWDKVMSRKMYNSQHKLMQKELDNAKFTEVEFKLENGKTQGIEVKNINRKQREEYAKFKADNDKLKTENANLRIEAETCQMQLEDIKEEKLQLERQNAKLKQETEELKKDCQSIWDIYKHIQEAIRQWLNEIEPMLEALKKKVLVKDVRRIKEIQAKGVKVHQEASYEISNLDFAQPKKVKFNLSKTLAKVEEVNYEATEIGNELDDDHER